MNQQTKWSLKANGKGLYILKLESAEGVDQLWVSDDELIELKQFLTSLDLPLSPNELPL